jgi:hypothetical protein
MAEDRSNRITARSKRGEAKRKGSPDTGSNYLRPTVQSSSAGGETDGRGNPERDKAAKSGGQS